MVFYIFALHMLQGAFYISQPYGKEDFKRHHFLFKLDGFFHMPLGHVIQVKSYLLKNVK